MALEVAPPAGGPVERVTVTDQVYRQLRDGLMSGRFAPGEKFTIRGLAETLGSSPMPVREALSRLHAQNAIEMSDTGRVRVTRLSPCQLVELRDARIALEGQLVEKAAKRMRSGDLTEVRAIFDAMAAAVADGDQGAYVWANFAFHRRIYQAADSALILGVVESLWLLVGPHFTLLAPDAQHLAHSMAAHEAIVRALSDRDSAAARDAVARDIGGAARSLVELIAARTDNRKAG